MANNSAGFDITGAQQQQQNFSHYGVNNIQAQNVPGYQQQDQGHMRTQSNFGEVDASFAGGYGDQNSHAHQKGRHGSGKGGERKGSNKKGKGSGKKGANGKHYQAVENNNESAAHLQTQNIAAESSGTSYYTASASSQIAKDINGSANQQQQNLVPAGFNPGLHNQPGFQVTAAIQNSGKKNSQNANNSSNAKKAAQEDHEAAVNSFEEIQDDQVLFDINFYKVLHDETSKFIGMWSQSIPGLTFSLQYSRAGMRRPHSMLRSLHTFSPVFSSFIDTSVCDAVIR